ncbi:neuroblast differentiation-associated protein AHNAK-like [Chaetodon trifascialis]|uniref:neuroblast differentiation-associated protein AHNAK-like n=1 Tax=Chaetodon trifascialis TaxID=109706 RepID=UPI003992163E
MKTTGTEHEQKGSKFKMPKFGITMPKVTGPEIDLSLSKKDVDVTLPEAKAVQLPDVKIRQSSAEVEIKAPEIEAGISMPKVHAEHPHVDVSLLEGEVKVKQPEMEIKAPELEAEHGQGSKFKLPKFGITVPKVKGSEEHLNASQKDVDITLPKVKAEVKLPEIEVKSSACVEITDSETEAKSKDVGGSPLKFKMPTMKMPKFGSATYDVTIEAPDADKVAKTDGTKLKEDIAVNIKGPSVDIKTDVSNAGKRDTEMTKTETDSVGHSSPSKFKLPLFKMPKLSFSKSKPEDKTEADSNEDQLEMEVEPKGESKSPKMTLTSFGEIFKNIDVEFDVPKTEKEEETLGTSKDVRETDETSEKQIQPKEKETSAKQDTTKSPERTGWFKFPKFGLSSPSEPAKISEKVEHKDEKSPVRETGDEEISPTFSVQSSDAFADISSAMTSEHVGLSLSSPTKVTVKYSDPNTVTGLEEMHSNIITSTTRTELISVEPNLPEKITILSSGVSSSSEDTLRLESGKIHVFSSNIQATPEAQHAKLLTAVQVQSAEGLPLRSQASEASSWTVEDSQSGKRMILERHLVRETSSERSESKETIVVTKQITHMFDSSEPISGETASSIQRLRDSVHSEKMKFFDGDEK